MRKGLTIALMTVAIAFVSVQAMAFAPVIKDIPSPIVGSNESVTGGSPFVYPDAMDLNVLATDDFTANTDLMWTYAGSSLHYLINGVNPIVLGTTDPTSPTASQIINKKVSGGEVNPDGKTNTITIRNKNLAPIGGALNPPAGANGIVAAETQLVTFFCSDGNLFSSKTVFFYTDKGGANRLSGGGLWESVKPLNDFTGSGTWWAKDKMSWSVSGGGTATTHSFNASGGMCLEVSAAGSNMVDLVSPYAYFTLAKNTLYKLTLKMNGSQSAVGSTPLWDFIIINANNNNVAQGSSMYAQDTMFYDNTGYGGANTVLNSANGVDYAIYFAPGAVETAQWNDATTGAFSPAQTAGKDSCLMFRVLDVAGAASGFGENKSGAVCLQALTIESVPITRVSKVGNSLVSITDFNAAGTTGGNVEIYSLLQSDGQNTQISTTFNSDGSVTIAPTTTLAPTAAYGNVSGQTYGCAEMRPASDTTFGDPSTSTYLDNWPIHWDSDKLLRFQLDVSAPTAADAAKPWDAIFLNMGAVSSEILYEHYITSAKGVASPKVGSAQTYEAFFNTMKQSSRLAAWQQLRWVVRCFNSPVANFPSNSTADLLNTGAVKYSGLRVDVVEVK